MLALPLYFYLSLCVLLKAGDGDECFERKKNDWFDLFGGYVILAGIVAVVAGFGISRILNGWGFSSLIPMGVGGGVIIGLSTAKAVRNQWFSTAASKRKALVGTNVAIMSVFAAAIFAIVGFLNVRHYERFDLYA